MTALPTRPPAPLRLPETLAAVAACCAGFALACWLFYPGLVTHDALAVYDQAQAGAFGDWQPPLLGVLWIWLETLFGYGPQAIFLPTIAVYWAGLLILFLGLRPLAGPVAWLVPLVGILPPTFALLGIVWRDVIFSALWMLAFALAFATADRGRKLRIAATVLALAAFLIGFWMRPNALFAAAPLLLYILAPARWRWWRLILLAVPVWAGLQASAYAVNYGWLKAREDHVLHSVFVFDLAGITHFSGENAFPVTWTPDEFERVKTQCYRPTYWDAFWWKGCEFAMGRIDADTPPGTKLFGSERLRSAWIAAILAHPGAYLEHRFAHFAALMTERNMVMFDPYASGQYRFMPIRSQAYAAFADAIARLHAATPLFRGLTWLILTVLVGLAGLRLEEGRARAAVLALSTSSLVYLLTYLPLGVAAEYRYVYWSALASLLAAAIVLAKWRAGSSRA